VGGSRVLARQLPRRAAGREPGELRPCGDQHGETRIRVLPQQQKITVRVARPGRVLEHRRRPREPELRERSERGGQGDAGMIQDFLNSVAADRPSRKAR